MKYKEESYVLDTLKEIRDFIRSPTIEQLVKETHENNIMLKDIVKAINTYVSHHHNENNADFMRNILANLISNGLDGNKILK